MPRPHNVNQRDLAADSGARAVSVRRGPAKYWRHRIICAAMGLLLSFDTAAPAGPGSDRMEGLIDADRSAGSTLWTSGFREVLRQSFDSDGVLLLPGAQLLTAGRLLLLDTDTQPSPSGMRMSWDPLGLIISGDSTTGVTWGVVTQLQDSNPPATGRYVAAWQHGSSGWRIAACALLGVSPPSRQAWELIGRSIPGEPPDSRAQPFLNADRGFARLAADSGAALAFRTWAASDAMIFGRRGFIIRGADMIGRAVDGPARWRWDPVTGGGSSSGNLGWTVGEATISPDEGAPARTKYLSVWHVGPDGSVRFIIDAGNARP